MKLVYDTSKYRNANDAARHNALTVVREDEEKPVSSKPDIKEAFARTEFARSTTGRAIAMVSSTQDVKPVVPPSDVVSETKPTPSWVSTFGQRQYEHLLLFLGERYLGTILW